MHSLASIMDSLPYRRNVRSDAYCMAGRPLVVGAAGRDRCDVLADFASHARHQ